MLVFKQLFTFLKCAVPLGMPDNNNKVFILNFDNFLFVKNVFWLLMFNCSHLNNEKQRKKTVLWLQKIRLIDFLSWRIIFKLQSGLRCLFGALTFSRMTPGIRAFDTIKLIEMAFRRMTFSKKILNAVTFSRNN